MAATDHPELVARAGRDRPCPAHAETGHNPDCQACRIEARRWRAAAAV